MMKIPNNVYSSSALNNHPPICFHFRARNRSKVETQYFNHLYNTLTYRIMHFPANIIVSYYTDAVYHYYFCCPREVCCRPRVKRWMDFERPGRFAKSIWCFAYLRYFVSKRISETLENSYG